MIHMSPKVTIHANLSRMGLTTFLAYTAASRHVKTQKN